MRLLLDIGNSSVNWAMEEAGQFTIYGAFRYDKNIFDCLEAWVEQRWQLKCWQPSVSDKFNRLKNSYINTQEMGIDRWLAMVAAWEKHQVALCIVGCGTALTIDSIDSQGNHLGGYIVPGIELMQQALVMKTECINVSINKHASTDYAQDTQAAINNGAFLATTSMIDHVVKRLSDKLETLPKCVIFGGMTELISPLLQDQFEHDPNLVLSGLSIVHRTS